MSVQCFHWNLQGIDATYRTHRCTFGIFLIHQILTKNIPTSSSLFFLSFSLPQSIQAEAATMGAERFLSSRDSPRKGGGRATLGHLFDLESPKSSPSSPRSRASANEEMLSIISSCCSDASKSPSQQDLKRLKLTQLLYLIKANRRPVDEHTIVPPLMAMVRENIFRPLPPPSSLCFIADLADDEEPVAVASPLWTHLQVVYEVFQRVLSTSDPESLRPHIDRPFLNCLLSLFQSEDPRERLALKNAYHSIYARLTYHRAFMRKSMTDTLLTYVFETEKHCGIGEILEIFGSIINGFAVPLKEEHKMFLKRVLLPLHKAKGTMMFHKQLSYCVSQFVQKEPVLGGVVVRGILRYWPMTNSQKEVLILDEVEDLVEIVDPEQHRNLALPLCKKIATCLTSLNSLVAERALYMWNNEQFVKMVSVSMEEVLPIIVESMEKNLHRHWSPSICQLTQNVKLMLEEMDPSFYGKCMEREQKEKVESVAATTNPNGDEDGKEKLG